MLSSLTEKLYNEQYKSQGWNILHIGATQSWRTEWGTWESIRDLVQNSLDETESFRIERVGNDLIVRDNGTGLAIRDLLLGAKKPKEPYCRGKFGEGLKVAALSLLRLGYGVEVETVGKSIIFCMYEQVVDNEKASTLAALWKNSEINQILGGTSVIIRDYPDVEDDYLDRFTHTANLEVLHKTKATIKEPSQRYNYIFKAAKGQGQIFCRNIYLQDIDGCFSYDLWDFELSPDRHAPRYNFQLWENISKLWQTVSDENSMVRFLKAIRDNEAKYLKTEISLHAESYEMTPDGVPYKRLMEVNSGKWNRAFIKAYGDDAVIKTGEHDNLVSHIGYRAVELPSGIMSGLRDVVRTSESVIKKATDDVTEIETINDSQLDPKHLLLINAARELVDFSPRQISGVFAANIPLTDGLITLGTYHRPTNQILLSISALNSWSNMVELLVHETAHSLRQAHDNTDEFTRDMQIVAEKFITAIMKHPKLGQKYESIMN